MIMKEMYLTNSVVKRLMGLRPIADAVPEIKSTMDALPKAIPARRGGCSKCKKRSGTIPPSAAKAMALTINGLSADKKLIVLNTLGITTLRGFLPSSGRLKSAILAEK